MAHVDRVAPLGATAEVVLLRQQRLFCQSHKPLKYMTITSKSIGSCSSGPMILHCIQERPTKYLNEVNGLYEN